MTITERFRSFTILHSNDMPIVAKCCEKPLVKPTFNAAGIHGADGLGELAQFKEADGTPRYPKLRFTTGMSLADRRDRKDEETNPPNVEACLDVDTERFMQLFAQLVCSVPAQFLQHNLYRWQLRHLQTNYSFLKRPNALQLTASEFKREILPI